MTPEQEKRSIKEFRDRQFVMQSDIRNAIHQAVRRFYAETGCRVDEIVVVLDVHGYALPSVEVKVTV